MGIRLKLQNFCLETFPNRRFLAFWADHFCSGHANVFWTSFVYLSPSSTQLQCGSLIWTQLLCKLASACVRVLFRMQANASTSEYCRYHCHTYSLSGTSLPPSGHLAFILGREWLSSSRRAQIELAHQEGSRLGKRLAACLSN